MSATENKLPELLQQYIQSLSEKETKAYNIAKSHLGSSFSLEKSRGFIIWRQKLQDSMNAISAETK
jgi:hypothetical protein